MYVGYWPYFCTAGVCLCIMQTVVCKKESSLYWAEIAVSMDGKAVALVDKSGYLWGGSADFKVGSKYSCFSTCTCTCTLNCIQKQFVCEQAHVGLA